MATATKTRTTPALLEARDLTLAYGRAVVLKDVSVRIERGDWWFILGTNGSGKTTLVRSFLGLIEPAGGALIREGGRTAPEYIGFVPQRSEFNQTLPVTVKEFVLLGLVGLRLTRAEESERLAWALRMVGLSGMHARRYWNLSGGERQRALLARALIRRPSVLFLDEPTNELDVRARWNFLRLLDRIHKEQGITILLVTHQLELAREYGTHVMLLSDGGLLSGPGAQILTQENLDRLFGEEHG